MTEKTLNKYKLVIDEWFINGFNGTQAYMKFYPKSKEETATVKFNRLVRIGKIENYISEKRKAVMETLHTSHEALLNELVNWAYSDITETMMLTSEQVKELPVEIKRLITKYKRTVRRFGEDGENEEEVVELWFVSKEKAMEMIHKHTGFYEKDNIQKKESSVTIFKLPDNDRS